LILWKPTGLARPESLKADEVVENCSWKATRTLVAHNDDIQDVSWAPHSDMLMSGSVDNSCIVWDSLKCASPHHFLRLASQTSAPVWVSLGVNQWCEAKHVCPRERSTASLFLSLSFSSGGGVGVGRCVRAVGARGALRVAEVWVWV